MRFTLHKGKRFFVYKDGLCIGESGDLTQAIVNAWLKEYGEKIKLKLREALQLAHAEKWKIDEAEGGLDEWINKSDSHGRS